MSEKGNQNQIDKLKKQFAKNNNQGNKPNGPKRSGFNFYWVYAIIFALFIGMQIFSAMSFRAKNSNFRDFEQKLELGETRASPPPSSSCARGTGTPWASRRCRRGCDG